MTPTVFNVGKVVKVKIPTKTYKYYYDSDDNNISGTTDGSDAIKQAIYKILNTDRKQYAIYSFNYGIDIQDLFGKDMDYVIARIPTRITEALVQDDRISDCIDFKFKQNNRGTLTVTFKAVTDAGDIDSNLEVSVYG